MKRYNLNYLREIEWLANSEYIQSFDIEENDQYIDIPNNISILPDDLSNQKLIDVIESTRYFIGKPRNFYGYIRNRTDREFDELINLTHDKEKKVYIQKLADIPFKFPVKLSKFAIENDNLELFEYIYNHGLIHMDSMEKLVIMACEKGSLNCLRFLHEQGAIIDNICLDVLVANGNFDCVKYLCQNNCKPGLFTLGFATKVDNLDMFVYLYKYKAPMTIWTASSAALNNNLEALMFLHEHGCEWNDMTTSNSAKDSHIGCFMYACEHGCPIHPGIRKMIKGQYLIIDYLNMNGY